MDILYRHSFTRVEILLSTLASCAEVSSFTFFDWLMFLSDRINESYEFFSTTKDNWRPIFYIQLRNIIKMGILLF